jgi:outer membrane protein assembly factor BamE (lipoprotein component of BamABCDE complex)
MRWVLLLVLLTSAACQSGTLVHVTPSDPAALAEVKIGTFTNAEVESLLGSADSTEQGATGEVWVYYLTRTTMGQTNMGQAPVVDMEAVGIEFDPRGHVTGISPRSSHLHSPPAATLLVPLAPGVSALYNPALPFGFQ